MSWKPRPLPEGHPRIVRAGLYTYKGFTIEKVPNTKHRYIVTDADGVERGRHSISVNEAAMWIDRGAR